MIEFVQGDLLEAQADALVNAVNTEGVMGKGIAQQFKERFPRMYSAYRQACIAGEVRPGRMHVFDCGAGSTPRFIINFPTKRAWRLPTRLEDVDSGLSALVREIQDRQIQSVAVPALGCGNGGLDWEIVLPKIRNACANLKDVHVMIYPPRQETRGT
jgi:O-acetyl-ADP-ribose deacetylase (regulator of RNase III)